MLVCSGRRQGKIDKKYFVFGEDPEEGEDSHILGRIKRLLRETDIALLIDGEVIIFTLFFAPYNASSNKLL